MNNDEQYNIRTVDRALSILKLFLSGDSELSLTDISHRVHLTQSTVYRYLVTLVMNGFLEQSPQTGRYRLGVVALALGDAFLRHNDLCQRAHPALVQLRDNCGETVHLAVLEGNDVVYLDKLPGLHPIGLMSSRVGGRSAAYCTGVGKVLLAFQTSENVARQDQNQKFFQFTPNTITTLEALRTELRKIRQQGYGIDNEEHELGVACIAAPIFNHRGVIAALSASGPSERITSGGPDLIRLVMETANAVSISFGGSIPSLNS